MDVYYHIARTRFLVSLVYRFEVFASLGAQLVVLGATVFLWRTAFQGTTSAAGVTERQMITFAIMAVLLGTVFENSVENLVNQRIREGLIAVDLLRPVNLLLMWLAQDVGKSLANLGLILLPLLLIAIFGLQAPMPVSWGAFALFLPACLLSYLILWLMSAQVAMIAFWVLELGNMRLVKNALLRLLSGSLIPLWFFPLGLQKVCRFLPFQYTYQGPIGIYVGRTSLTGAGGILLIQCVWIGLLSVALAYTWSRAQRRVLVQGG